MFEDMKNIWDAFISIGQHQSRVYQLIRVLMEGTEKEKHNAFRDLVVELELIWDFYKVMILEPNTIPK